MKFAEKVKEITAKAENNKKKELKAIKELKYSIKYNAKRREHTAHYYLYKDELYNIDFIINYLKKEGLQVELNEADLNKSDGKYLAWKIIVSW